MWCFNWLKNLLLTITLVSSLSACVVRPVYKSDNVVAPTVLSNIALSKPTDRFTQIIDNKLVDLLHTASTNKNNKYKLKVTGQYNYRTNLIGTDRMNLDVSAQAISGIVEATGSYVLETNSGRKLASAVVRSATSYDRLEQEYANLKARERATMRVAEDLAEQIYMSLMAWQVKPAKAMSR
ncbi:MAG: hypothetical protein QWI73_00120 [Alphaproteobacteria bacterium]|nr:hypothetical protein [Alphaproteobacteria bacterium]